MCAMVTEVWVILGASVLNSESVLVKLISCKMQMLNNIWQDGVDTASQTKTN